MSDELNKFGSIINRVLAQRIGTVNRNGRMIPIARISQATQSSAFNVYLIDIVANSATIASVTRTAPEIDNALTRYTGNPVYCRFDTAPLRVFVPRSEPQYVNFFDAINGLRSLGDDGVLMLAGEVVNGMHVRPYVINLASASIAQIFVAGTTGSGKTTLVRNLVLSLSMLNDTRNLEIVALDPKMAALTCLDGLPGLKHEVLKEPGDCVDALKEANAEIERRKRRGILNPKKKLVVAIDEIAELIKVTDGKTVVEQLEGIAQIGREFGVHLIAATQKPLADKIGSVAKANFPTRFAGNVSSTDDAKTALGVKGSHAEQLPGKGAFVVKTPATMRTIQVYANEPHEIAAYLRNTGISIPRYQSAPDEMKYTGSQSIPAEISVSVPVNTGIDTAADTGRQLAFDVYGSPTHEEARIIRALLRSGMSKNRIINEVLPPASRNKCFEYINAALSRQEVGA